MKKLLYFLLFMFFISCMHNEVPKESNLIAKYIVFDEHISPELNVCSDTIYKFKSSNTTCLFKLDDLLFEPEFRIGLNDEGHMMTLDQHSVTKNINYEKFGIEKDTTNWDKANGNNFWIRFTEQRDKIIDGTDTLEIENVYPNESLIFVESKNEKKGRRFIYEYK